MRVRSRVGCGLVDLAVFATIERDERVPEKLSSQTLVDDVLVVAGEGRLGQRLGLSRYDRLDVECPTPVVAGEWLSKWLALSNTFQRRQPGLLLYGGIVRRGCHSVQHSGKHSLREIVQIPKVPPTNDKLSENAGVDLNSEVPVNVWRGGGEILKGENDIRCRIR